jgi:hypothetical protein
MRLALCGFPPVPRIDARIRTDPLNRLMLPGHSDAFFLMTHLKKLTAWMSAAAGGARIYETRS